MVSPGPAVQGRSGYGNSAEADKQEKTPLEGFVEIVGIAVYQIFELVQITVSLYLNCHPVHFVLVLVIEGAAVVDDALAVVVGVAYYFHACITVFARNGQDFGIRSCDREP